MITGSKILFNSLLSKNVKYIFGYSGGAILPVLNEFYGQDKIKFIMSRTESGAGFMAEGYAKSKREPGIVMTTSGPGVLNTVTSMQNALSDGTPVLYLSGQVSTNVLGTNAFQEANVIDITKSCTKWNTQIKDIITFDLNINKAFEKMLDKRHGPVLLDLPKDIMSKNIHEKLLKDGMLNYTTNCTTNKKNMLQESFFCKPNINHLISKSKKPVILAGQGIFQTNSVDLLRKFALHNNIPVTTTLLGLGIFDERHNLSLHMLGMHGSYYANKAIQNSDLILNFGSRFDDRITGKPDLFAKNATIVHVDIDKTNINKTIKSDYSLNEDCRTVLENTLKYKGSKTPDFSDWHEQIQNWKNIRFSFPIRNDILYARRVISRLNLLLHKDTINKYTIVADVGSHQMWTAQFIDYNFPKIKFITSGGLGSMGFALPASIGVKLGSNSEKVICICGDGGFTMSFVELLTAIDNKINIKVMIINNSKQSMVSMWQKLFYEGRYIATDMKNPPFEKVVESLGCKSLRIDIHSNLDKDLQYFLDYEDGPIVANVITYDDEPVLPMVSPGFALDNMVIDENLNHKFDGDAPC